MHPLLKKKQRKRYNVQGGSERVPEPASQPQWLLSTGIEGGDRQGQLARESWWNHEQHGWCSTRSQPLDSEPKLQAGGGMYRLRRRAAFRRTKPSGRMEVRSLRRMVPVRCFQARIRRRSTCLAVECDFLCWGLDLLMRRDGWKWYKDRTYRGHWYSSRVMGVLDA